MKNRLLKATLLFSLFTFIVLSNTTCKKGINEQNHNCPQGQHWDEAQQKCVVDSIDEISDTLLSPEEDSILASLADTVFKPSQLFFPDGESFEDYAMYNDSPLIKNWGQKIYGDGKNSYKKFLEIITNRATYYTNDANFQKPDEGANKPKQDGLAYVLSDTNYHCDYLHRNPNGKCSDLLYGFECNGFVSRLFMDAGVMKHRYTTTDLTKPETYNKLFAASTEYKDLKYEYKGKINVSEMQAGDIVYFKHTNGTIFHLGIICRTSEVVSPNSPIFVYQSNGQPSKTSKTIPNGCENNTSKGRGPRCVPVGQFINMPDFNNYYVLKLIGSGEPTLEIEDGNNQTGELGKVLPKELKVQVNTFNNDPLKNKSVFFTPSNATDKVENVINPTDKDGIASIKWTLMDVEGEHTLYAIIKDEDGKNIDTATFTANATTNTIQYFNYSVVSFERKYHDTFGNTDDVSSSGESGLLTLYPNTDSCTLVFGGAGFNWYLYGSYSGTDVTLTNMNYVDGLYHPLSSPIIFSTLDQEISFTIHIAYYYQPNDGTYYDDDPVVLEKQ